jgi:hypothetical protein
MKRSEDSPTPSLCRLAQEQDASSLPEIEASIGAEGITAGEES